MLPLLLGLPDVYAAVCDVVRRSEAPASSLQARRKAEAGRVGGTQSSAVHPLGSRPHVGHHRSFRRGFGSQQQQPSIETEMRTVSWRSHLPRSDTVRPCVLLGMHRRLVPKEQSRVSTVSSRNPPAANQMHLQLRLDFANRKQASGSHGKIYVIIKKQEANRMVKTLQ